MHNALLPYPLAHLPPELDIVAHPQMMGFLQIHNEALKEISELNGALRQIDNPNLLLSTFYLKESISSSAVEHIYTTIESALKDETKPEEERTIENKEVINYRTAMIAGAQSHDSFGLTTRTIKTIHRELKVKRGIPGEFRKSQNSIANRRSDGTTEVIYTPPEAAKIESYLGNWETFVAEDLQFFPLIKTAIAHYQFEAIHPFEDGNGRAGRILMVLQLKQLKLLDYPLLFLSGYLSEHELNYKECLRGVTEKGDWWTYLDFMLKAFSTQSLKTRVALLQLKAERKNLRKFLFEKNNVIRKTNIPIVVDHLFQNPTTHPKFMEQSTGIHWQTCSKYLRALAAQGVLIEVKSGRYKFFTNKVALNALVVK